MQNLDSHPPSPVRIHEKMAITNEKMRKWALTRLRLFDTGLTHLLPNIKK